VSQTRAPAADRLTDGTAVVAFFTGRATRRGYDIGQHGPICGKSRRPVEAAMKDPAQSAGGRSGVAARPARAGGGQVTAPLPESGAEAGAAAAKPRILIADDREESRYILRRFAEPDAEVVAEVENGMEAVRVAGQLRPAVAILDVSMPVMGGIEAARLIHERFPELRIIFASQHTDREYVEEAFRAGGHAYIVKQAAADELPAAIRDVLAGREYRSPLTGAATRR
jgi:CheY-like chemotaxis protein